MPWDKESEEAFPAKHSREPKGLRQDILDEIADHLACATEREHEQDETGDEETVWRRVLDKFGDPDTVARRLWWDQMRETVMREWIQTGVLAVLAVASVAGVALLIVMMGRVDITNQAMEATMKQVAASNEALMEALAAQRADNTALLNALSGLPASEDVVAGAELYTVEVVLRRGSAEGAPAPEVRVTFEGKGPSDQDLTLKPELDEEGRVVFERLNQGTYTLTFYDPQSQLHARENITLFAGQGAGERVYVVPDLHPRPIHIAWDLPEYGRDEDLLVGAVLTGTWTETEGAMRWVAESNVASGHGGTWVMGEGGKSPYRRRAIANINIAHLISTHQIERAPCLLAGEIRVRGTVSLYKRKEDTWNQEHSFSLNPDREAEEPGRYSTDMILLEPNTEDVFPVAAPKDLLEVYSHNARALVNRANVPDSQYVSWLNRAAHVLTDRFVVAAGGALQSVPALWNDDGYFHAPGEISRSVVSDTGEGSFIKPQARVLGIPRRSEVQSLAENYLAVPVIGFGKGRVPVETPSNTRTTRAIPPDSIEGMEDTAGNVLGAYFIRSPWRDRELTLTVDKTPFWTMATEKVEEAVEQDKALFIPLPESAFDDGDQPATGVLVRFEESSEEFFWSFTLRDGDEVSDSSIWLGTQSISAWEGTKALNETEGRIHYDKLEHREVLNPRVEQRPTLVPTPNVVE